MLTNSTQVSLGSDSFLFDPEQAKTLMVTSLVESLLTSTGNILSASMLGSSRTNQSRIFYPGMHEDISSRYDIRSTVRNDVGEADKLNTTIDGSSTDKWNKSSSLIEESTLKSIFRKGIKKLDLSDRMNLTKSLSVHTPDLVSFKGPDHSDRQCT